MASRNIVIKRQLYLHVVLNQLCSSLWTSRFWFLRLPLIFFLPIVLRCGRFALERAPLLRSTLHFRIALDNTVVGRIRKKVWRRRSISLETKLKEWKALLYSYTFTQLNRECHWFILCLLAFTKFSLILSVYCSPSSLSSAALDG